MQIWNGSDEYCWRYRADTILSTDGQTDKVIPVYPPFNFVEARVGVKYFLKYLSQVQVLFHICKYKYKFKYSEYLEDINYIKYFFNQVQVKYKYFGNKQ